MKTLKIGDTVITRWGPSEIKKIEICPKPGDKYGLPTEEVYVDLIDRCIFDFEEGWQYGSQLDFIPH